MRRAAAAISVSALLLVWMHDRMPVSAAPPEPAWVHEGIVASSDMESLTFILRRGGGPDDVSRQWRAARSEETVRKLQAEGVNLAITNLHKGTGLHAESEDM